MDTNFYFLKAEEWLDINKNAIEAEKHAFTAPVTCAFYCRLTLEKTINWLYENDADLEEPYEKTLSARMYETTFKNIIPPSILSQLTYIRKEGNNAVHGKKVTSRTSLQSLKFLHRFISWFAKIYGDDPIDLQSFDESFIPKKGNGKKTIAELHSLQKEHDLQQEKFAEEQQKRLKAESALKELEEKLKLVKQRKEARKQLTVPPSPYSEAKTRTIFIDLMLREAGWDAEAENVAEFEVTGMPVNVNPSGKGYVDYVLWGDNGLPLALIEAKRTTVNPDAGKTQATLYADCLEKMFNQRPIIYCTNGYETTIWDDLFYNHERPVQGLATKNELQLLIDRRTTRKDIRKFPVNNDIVNRYYQKEAIKKISEIFVTEAKGKLFGNSRRALVVMATGAGKTRTAAALVEIFVKANWVKRVLFLADRNALVTQAKNSFKEHVPHLSSIDLTKERQDDNTRLVFSTYPTIMNRIDQSRNADLRFYSPAHFDLIIVDEAHRSVYQKYKAIFDYFDALLVGLTATPKNETDHDTYELFECEEHVPTYFYELEKAVNDKFLVPAKGQPVDLGFIKRGIKYDELSEKDKIQYEKTFRDHEGNIPKEISGTAINSWLFNANTIDKVINHLMEYGIKVEGGDKIGKTIIFARSHKHAVEIEKRFTKQYPNLGSNFVKIIDNYDRYAQKTLSDFTEKDKNPQIAISVDMLDTGVDVPEIVNLVFFKPVYSKAKFWQMIGRGTRLCEDLFGPGDDKKEFNIFDFCGNFDFFDVNPEGIETAVIKSLSQQIFETRILISEELRDKQYQEEKYIKYRTELLDLSHQLIKNLWEQRTNFRIKAKIKYVDKFKERTEWDALTQGDISDIFNNLGDLVIIDEKDELAKRFDLLLYNLQLAELKMSPERDRYINLITATAINLLKISNIPAVKNKLGLIKMIAEGNLIENDIELNNLEEIRKNIRDLIKLIKKDTGNIYFTDLKDTIEIGEVREIGSQNLSSNSYKNKVEKFIKDHKHNLIITKLRTNSPITSGELKQLENIIFDGDERGTIDDYKKENSDTPLGVFIRKIVGLDVNAAKKVFSDFIDEFSPTSNQIRFIDTIIEHLTQNGIIEPGMLYEVPFTDIDDQGIDGIFKGKQIEMVFDIIKEVNKNAEVKIS